METDRDIEEVARKRVEARNGFVIHVALYALINAGLVVIWLATGRGYPWFIWPLFGWGIGILAHLLGWRLGPGSAQERQAIEREIQKLRAAHR
jgi:hypothetical protein